MAKITELTAIDAVAGEDLFATVDAPSGAAVTKKATAAQLRTYVLGIASSIVNIAEAVALGATLTVAGDLVVTAGTATIGGAAAIAGTVTASNAASATSGGVVIKSRYSGGTVSMWGTEYSSGGPVMGYGVTPSTSAAGAFLSGITGVSLPRAAYTISGETHYWYAGAAQTVDAGSAVSMSEVMSAHTTAVVVRRPLTVTAASAEVDLFLTRTGTNALSVYLYNTGTGAGYYDGTNGRTVWNYNPSSNVMTFGNANLDVSNGIAQVRALPTDGAYTGSAFQSIVTRAASTAFDHFYATANGAVVARIRGDGSALFAQAVTVSAGGITVTGNSTITGSLGGIAGLTVASGGASVAGGLAVNGTTGITGDFSASGTVLIGSDPGGSEKVRVNGSIRATNFVLA